MAALASIAMLAPEHRDMVSSFKSVQRDEAVQFELPDFLGYAEKEPGDRQPRATSRLDTLHAPTTFVQFGKRNAKR